MARLALLANPDSGSGQADEVERRIGAAAEVELRRFSLDEAGAAVASQPHRIVVAGGDGSIGCAAEAARDAGVPLAVVAAGTANDFARTLGLPDEIDAACALAVSGARDPPARSRPLRRAPVRQRRQRRPATGCGASRPRPQAAARAVRLRGRRAARRGQCRADHLRRSSATARGSIDGDAWQVTVALTGAFGGGSEVAADPADGLLDVVIVEAGSRLRLALRGFGLRRGEIESQTGVHSCDGREISVLTSGDAGSRGFNVDGEVVEERAARFTIEPGAFEVVVG